MSIQKIAKSDIIKQGNKLTTASYSLSRDQKRIVWMILRSMSKQPELFESSQSVAIDIKEYAAIFNLSNKEAGKDIREALSAPWSQVRFHTPKHDDKETGEEASLWMPWLAETAYRPKEGKFYTKFSTSVMPFIRVGSQFTLLALENCAPIVNPHAVRLYESLAQYRSTGMVILGVDWMRERYALPKSYKKFSLFRQYFIEAAVKEIREKTMLDLNDPEYIYQKTKIVSVKFTFVDRGVAPEYIKSYKEQSQNKPRTSKEVETPIERIVREKQEREQLIG